MRSRISRSTRAWLAASVSVSLALTAAAVAGGVFTSAQAASPTYTVTTGSTGPYNYADDTPAYPYIDSDGTFYFQSAHSLYGATDSRAWQFWSGKNIDTGVSKAAISSAAANADTTTRCNTSVTGQIATNAPAGSSYAEKNYCDLIGVWVDPDTGAWYGIVHNEFTPQPFGDGLHYDSIDYARSTDHGSTWTIQDHIITSPFSTARGDTSTTGGFPNQTYYFGDGDPRLFVDYTSGYFYVFYATRILNKSSSGSIDFGHVARAPISSKMAPSSWKKWYAGSWSQPGTGGKEAEVVPYDGTNAGYVDDAYNPATTGTVQQQQTAGTLPTAAPFGRIDAAWDAYLGKYITTGKAADAADTALHYYVSSDLATQKWTDVGSVTAPAGTGWYRSLLDGTTLTSAQLVGKAFRSYCMYNCGSTAAEWVSTTIDTASANLPTPPVASGTAYQIAAGDGQYLAQSGSALTTASASSSAGSQGWKFTATGDGFFTIANASSGQNIGVNDTANAGRAWGASLSLGTGTSVGWQWSIQRVNDANVSGGGYRLVNRYSGLALSLTSGTGGVVTAPQRDWANTGTSGDTHAVDAQVLAFPASGANAITVTNPGPQHSAPNTAITPLQIGATDSASGQTLTYSATGLPAGLSIGSSSGSISGTPTATGSSTVTVTAADTTGAHGSTTFAWTVGSPNLLSAGNFESGNLGGWTVRNATIVTDAAAHSPTHDLQLKSPASDYATMEYTVTGLSPNTSYTYSGWVRSDTGGTVSFGVKNYGGSQVTAHTSATGWTPESDAFTTGATNTSATVFCYLPSSSATATCDDLTVTAN